MAHCPECEAEIDIDEDDVDEGQMIDCPECEAELEVLSTNPLRLGLIREREEEDEEI